MAIFQHGEARGAHNTHVSIVNVLYLSGLREVLYYYSEVQTSTVRTDKDCGSCSAQERQRMTSATRASSYSRTIGSSQA